MPTMTLAQFARHLGRAAAVMPVAERQALDAAGRRIADQAADYIGEYQPRLPPFPAWRFLADATVTERIRLGFTPDDPLLRTGRLRDSIGHVVRGRAAVVGSPSEVARYQEFGTDRVPPRSFLGRAVAASGRSETVLIAERVFRPLLTGRF